MSQTPRISVLLNCYNQADYVRDAVESVLAQTFVDFELIATDNGSTDDTPKILSQYANHPKVRLNLCSDNQTVSRRFNQAIALARGEFVTFLYSDDWYFPYKLEHQVSLFDQLPPEYGLVYAPLHVYNQITGKEWDLSAPVITNDSLAGLLTTRDIGTIDMISPMIRRECFVRHPFLDDVFAEGEGIFLRVALTHRIHFDPKPVSVMRDTGENRGKAIRKNIEMHWKTLETLEADPAFDPKKYGPLLRQYQNLLLTNSAWCNLRMNGPAGWSYRQFFRSICIKPTCLTRKRFLAGLILGLAPLPLRRLINRQLDHIMGVKANSTVVESYGGSS
jgi:glycosyltransferase involved in cell wall biosynthesis